MIDQFQQNQLLGGGDCQLHWHSIDRVVRHETLEQTQAIMRQRSVSGTYTITDTDDILLCASGGTLTLPLAKAGREFEVIMTGTTDVTVNLTSPDEIYGETSVLIEEQGTALRFKAVTGGWVFI